MPWTERRRMTDRARGLTDGHIQTAGNERTGGNRGAQRQGQAPSPGPPTMRPPDRAAAVPPCSGPAGQPLPHRSCPFAQRSSSSCLSRSATVAIVLAHSKILTNSS